MRRSLFERPSLWAVAAVVLVAGGGPAWSWLLCLILFVATSAGRGPSSSA